MLTNEQIDALVDHYQQHLEAEHTPGNRQNQITSTLNQFASIVDATNTTIFERRWMHPSVNRSTTAQLRHLQQLHAAAGEALSIEEEVNPSSTPPHIRTMRETLEDMSSAFDLVSYEGHLGVRFTAPATTWDMDARYRGMPPVTVGPFFVSVFFRGNCSHIYVAPDVDGGAVSMWDNRYGWHPNVNSFAANDASRPGGTLCRGEAKGTIAAAFQRGQIDQIMGLCRALLATCSDLTPYNDVRQWHGVPVECAASSEEVWQRFAIRHNGRYYHPDHVPQSAPPIPDTQMPQIGELFATPPTSSAPLTVGEEYAAFAATQPDGSTLVHMGGWAVHPITPNSYKNAAWAGLRFPALVGWIAEDPTPRAVFVLERALGFSQPPQAFCEEFSACGITDPTGFCQFISNAAAPLLRNTSTFLGRFVPFEELIGHYDSQPPENWRVGWSALRAHQRAALIVLAFDPSSNPLQVEVLNLLAVNNRTVPPEPTLRWVAHNYERAEAVAAHLDSDLTERVLNWYDDTRGMDPQARAEEFVSNFSPASPDVSPDVSPWAFTETIFGITPTPEPRGPVSSLYHNNPFDSLSPARRAALITLAYHPSSDARCITALNRLREGDVESANVQEWLSVNDTTIDELVFYMAENEEIACAILAAQTTYGSTDPYRIVDAIHDLITN